MRANTVRSPLTMPTKRSQTWAEVKLRLHASSHFQTGSRCPESCASDVRAADCQVFVATCISAYMYMYLFDASSQLSLQQTPGKSVICTCNSMFLSS